MSFSNKLIDWYQSNKRDLPWRNTANAYHIWLSEIILQQTRVDQGMPYYLAFLKEFPRVEDLASASEDKVLKMWQGLGYYSRARNLHHTAKEITNNYSGAFPSNYKEILQLKGIGAYTAAAISSFAFSLPYAVVDGNVIRVLSRVFGIDTPFDTTTGKKQFQELAQELLLKDDAATYNQAIMEFGAIQCKPKSPVCSACPMLNDCDAYNTNRVAELPVKSKKIKVKDRFLHYLMVEDNNGVYLRKRDKGIWIGLYEFPFLEFEKLTSEKQVISSEKWISFFDNDSLEIESVSPEIIHILSHQKIHAQFWKVKVNGFSSEQYEYVQYDSLLSYPVSRLTEKYLKSLELI